MKTWSSIRQMRQELLEDILVTIGNFDGVHLGHRNLLDSVIKDATKNSWFSLAVTFREHTSAFFRHKTPLLMTLDERCEFFAALGLKGCLVLDFTRDLASLTPENFLLLLKEWGARGIIVGHDFRFGAGAAGGTGDILTFCRRHGLLGRVIPPVKVNGEIVSSSRIRRLLQAGRVTEAGAMLDRSYRITGEVVHGAHRGRRLGFPTANLDIPRGRLLPGYGVYLVRVFLGERRYFGLANIGIRPTFPGQNPEMEIYLFDTCEDLYHKTLHVDFLSFIRKEQKFSSPAELVAQMKRDQETARRLLILNNGDGTHISNFSPCLSNYIPQKNV